MVATQQVRSAQPRPCNGAAVNWERTKFKCLSGCSTCCSKYVIGLSNSDLKRISKAIKKYGLPGDIFSYIIFRGDLEKHPMVQGKKVSGAMTLKRVNGSCIFLKDNKCSIYQYRPTTCKLYPFDPLFIESRTGSDMEMRIDDCPGIGKGCRANKREILRLAKKWRKERLEYDKLVADWNSNNSGDLIDFVKSLEVV